MNYLVTLLSVVLVACVWGSMPIRAEQDGASPGDLQSYWQQLHDQRSRMEQSSRDLQNALRRLQQASVKHQQQLRLLRVSLRKNTAALQELQRQQLGADAALFRLQKRLLNGMKQARRSQQDSLWRAWFSADTPIRAMRQHNLRRYDSHRLALLAQAHQRLLAEYQHLRQTLKQQERVATAEKNRLSKGISQNLYHQQQKRAVLQQAVVKLGELDSNLQDASARLRRLLNEKSLQEKSLQNVAIPDVDDAEMLVIGVLSAPDKLETPRQRELIWPLSGRALASHHLIEDYALNQGMLISGDADEAVLAPFGGRVAFSGEYGRLGTMVIIEHGDDYYSLLWNLLHSDVAEGQWLLSGEPVGIARVENLSQSPPRKEGPQPNIPKANSLPLPENQHQSLVYFEFRHHQETLLVEKWLPASVL